MKAVLYTEDMEPLTIVDVPADIQEYHTYRFFIPQQFQVRSMTWHEDCDTINDKLDIVEIRVDMFYRNSKKYPMLFVNHVNEEMALLLRPEYLAGQLSDLQRRERDAFVHGVVVALGKCF